MRLSPRARGRSRSPDPSELRSITDRAAQLWLLRVGFAVVVVAACASWPSITSVSATWIACATTCYLVVSTGALAVVRNGRTVALPVLQAGLLLDGIFLAATVAITGGAFSPLSLLLGVHVVGVTLACSYRTGLKLALWNTLLFLWVVQAIDAELVPGAATGAHGAAIYTALTVLGLWLLALGAAGFSAAGERELRRQKADLADLSAMVTMIDGTEASGDSSRIPAILLDRLRETYGFARGVVLASPEGELELLATTGDGDPPSVAAGMDQVMSRAWAEKACQLVRELDPSTDPRLTGLLPDARNVVVVPLFLVGGHRLGIVALERGPDGTTMHRWELEMIGQFAAHAALALYSAWLTEQREEQLRTIRELERRLRVHNAELETVVDERTEELRRVIADLREVDEQRRRLLQHVVRAAEDERRRISHDMHDDPVQKLAAVKMRLEMLANAHPELPEITEAHRTVASTIRSMRHMLFDLSPPILDEEGIGPALEYFLEHSPVSYEWSVEDELDAGAHGPSAQTRLILYRTAQEALINARKHADATTVRVTLEARDAGVFMAIEDDGVGFLPQDAVAAPGHLGLATMRERVEMAGGSCTLRSLPGAGTSLEVWLPIDEEPEASGQRPDAADGEMADVVALPRRIA
jgi:signal transduction histidine kinase